MNFGERLYQLRKERGISQRELAKQAEIDFTYLSKIEHGVNLPSSRTIRSLAIALDANELELFSLAGKVPVKLKAAMKASPALTVLVKVLSEKPLPDEVYLRMIGMAQEVSV